MTAAVGFPTLRLIRRIIGPYSLGSLAPGEVRITPQLMIQSLQKKPSVADELA